MAYGYLADALVGLHLGIVLYVVFGLLAVPVGIVRGWDWITSRRFRLSHLAMIGVVALQGALGQLCFLTRWEYDLRVAAGQGARSGSFMGRLLQDLLFFEPETISQAVLNRYYVAFALLALLCFWVTPPKARA